VPGTETKFRASVGTGFRVPSLFELFDPTYGNTDLTPEESDSWDAGIEQGLLAGKLKVGATYFELDTDNLIAFGFPGGYYNVPGVTHRSGVELTAAALVTSGLSVTAGYTYVDTDQANGERLIRVPRHNFVMGFDLKPMDKVAINVTAKYVADTLDDSFDARGILALEDYVLVNAKASYEFTPGWKAYVRGENLLDEEYETVIDYGTAGLSVYGGVQVALPAN
jgi:vitamin B12 transporter